MCVCVCECVCVCVCVRSIITVLTLILGTSLRAVATVSTGQSTVDSNSTSEGKNSIALPSKQRCSLKQGSEFVFSSLYRDT